MTRDQTIDAIAREDLLFETLEERGRDGLDFHEVSVAAARRALERAYDAGRAAALPRRAACPACGRDIEIRSL